MTIRVLTWWLRFQHAWDDLRTLYRANRRRRAIERRDARTLEGDALIAALHQHVEPPPTARVLPFLRG
jgi:hypothetical protein